MSLGCADVKFKTEAVDNLKAWTAWFSKEFDKLEQQLFDPHLDQAVCLEMLEKGDMPALMDEA